VVAVRNGVVITGRQPLPESPVVRALPPGPSPEQVRQPSPQTAIELVEECSRFQRDNQRLLDDNARLRADVARLASCRTFSFHAPHGRLTRFPRADRRGWSSLRFHSCRLITTSRHKAALWLEGAALPSICGITRAASWTLGEF
jgi:hypothetical protein